MRSTARLALLAGAGVVIADAGIVTLALPPLQRELHATVEGVAAVLGSYALSLALALWPARTALARLGPARTGAAGFVVVALASVLCAAAGSTEVLLVGRVAQACGGAAGLLAAFELVGPGDPLWRAGSVLAAGLGPVAGGVLTQALDWRAIFVAQVPVALVAALAAARGVQRAAPGVQRQTPATGGALALALLSAALSAVLFLLVLMLVAGRGASPLTGAAVVLALPLAAAATMRVRGGDVRVRARCGCLLVGAGVLTLAWLPGDSVWWAAPPEAFAGAGTGLALPALLREHDLAAVTRELSIRHLGVALALALLAPLIAQQLVVSTEHAKEQGVTLLLDARIAPQSKLTLAPALFAAVSSSGARVALRAAFEQRRASFSGGQLAAFDELARRSDDTLVAAVTRAFRWAFVICGLLAVLAALLAGGRWTAAVTACAAAVVLGSTGYAAIASERAPAEVAISDPCGPRSLPATGGIAGFLQDEALRVLDTTACTLGVPRERLLLAAGGDAQARDRLGPTARAGLDLLSGLGIGP